MSCNVDTSLASLNNRVLLQLKIHHQQKPNQPCDSTVMLLSAASKKRRWNNSLHRRTNPHIFPKASSFVVALPEFKSTRQQDIWSYSLYFPHQLYRATTMRISVSKLACSAASQSLILPYLKLRILYHNSSFALSILLQRHFSSNASLNNSRSFTPKPPSFLSWHILRVVHVKPCTVYYWLNNDPLL